MTVLSASLPVRVLGAVSAAFTVTSLCIAAPALAAPPSRTYYVALSGSDHNSGSNPRHPLRTLDAAQRVVRRALKSHHHAVRVLVGGGTYELSRPLDFGPQDSGSPTTPVSWQAMPGQAVTIAGGRRITATWTADPSRPGVFRARIDKGLHMDGLFVNGQRQILARYPNVNPAQKILDGYTTLADINARSTSWAHPELADLRALHCNTWGGTSFAVTGRDTTGNLALKWVGDNNRAQACSNPAVPIDPNHVVAENILSELDAPGEWYLDAPSGTLYFYPPAGTDLSTATVQTAEQDELIHIEGSSSARPVHDMTFAGFTFTATHRTLFDHTYEPLQLGDWAVARTGAFYTKNAANITITDSVFDQLGGNAVFMDGYNTSNVVSDSRFSNNGATNVQTVGSRAAVRDPSTWANPVRTLTDTTPGPKTNDYPRNITIAHNVMANNGRFEKQTAGVNISMSQDIQVIGNTIYGSPRSCVNINDGTWGGDLIQNNDIFNCVTETGDHGPINAWGRDRFWPLSAPDATQRQYALLDVVKPNVIDHNRIWHNSEWDIDLDDGSSNYQLTNNLLLNAGIKLRDGFFRTVENNIMVNGHVFEQVSHANDGDVIKHNITLSRLAYENVLTDPAVAKYQADNNLFWNNGDPVSGLGGSWAANGLDIHSLIANPQFVHGIPWVDPAMTDFTVGPNSPASTLGFVNFRMDNFGVPGAPGPPSITWPAPSSLGTIESQPEPLMGATVTSIYSAALQSSVGLGDTNGVYLQTVPATSYAGTHGLHAGDVIRAINGTQVSNRNSFWTVYNALPAGASLTLDLWRNQAALTVPVPKATAPELLNDTAGIVYQGSAWDWKNANRGGANSFMNDLWATTNHGDSFTITFNGSGIDLVTETNSDEGLVDISIDGTLDATVNCDTPTRMFQSQVYAKSGLAPGQHTLTGVMNTGSYLIVDAFRVHP